MKNISILTYTHTNCVDLWVPYLSSINKYMPQVNSFIMSNIFFPNYGKHVFLQYDETKNYCLEYIKCLKKIDSEYFIYMQEDFILYDKVNFDVIVKCVNLLENKDISFVRLIKCGSVTEEKIEENLFWITEPKKKHCNVNCFSMQPTIWKKTDFIKIYNNARCEKFGEYDTYIEVMNRMNVNGAYLYCGESLRENSFHYNSVVFPYIATALVKGKWNTKEYAKELDLIFKEYNIHPEIRGCC
jgi:hypothetical protein